MGFNLDPLNIFINAGNFNIDRDLSGLETIVGFKLYIDSLTTTPAANLGYIVHQNSYLRIYTDQDLTAVRAAITAYLAGLVPYVPTAKTKSQKFVDSLHLTSSIVASSVTTDTSSFDGILSASDTNVQLALDTIDDHHKNPKAHNYGLTTQSFTANNVDNKLDIDSQYFAPVGITITNTIDGTEFEVTEDGNYIIQYSINCECATSLARTFTSVLKVNNTTVINASTTRGYTFFNTDKTTLTSNPVTISMTTGSYVSVFCQVNNGYTNASVTSANLRIEKVI